MYALARIQFQKLSCDHPHAAERTLYSESVNMWKNHGVVLGSYNPLLPIVIIRTVNVPQIKQTNKLKARTNALIQQTKKQIESTN